MSRKSLTANDIKIHIDKICSFLETYKKHSEIKKFNSRFPLLKNILLNKKIIESTTYGKVNTFMFKFNKDFVLFPKDYEDILKAYQEKIKQQNQKFADNIEMRFIKKEESKKDIKSLEPEFHPVIENLKKEIDFLNQQIKSLKNKDEFSKEKIDKLQKENKKYITEYSAFINNKLIEIEQLKQELHKQQSQKNQISIIKIFGIPLIKKTTKTIK
jgi:chaperonin cofactor prefoldin